jgi:hypothetical protein
VDGAVDVGADGLAQVGVEVDEAGAVEDEVEVAVEALGERGVLDAEAGERDVALDDLDARGDELGHARAVELVQRAEHGRAGDHLLEPVERGAQRLLAQEHVDLADGGDAVEDHRQPDLADEPGGAGQQDLAAGEGADGSSRFGWSAGARVDLPSTKRLLVAVLDDRPVGVAGRAAQHEVGVDGARAADGGQQQHVGAVRAVGGAVREVEAVLGGVALQPAAARGAADDRVDAACRWPRRRGTRGGCTRARRSV